MFCTPTKYVSRDQLRRMRWAVHGARTGETRGAYRVWVGKPEESDYLEELGVDGRKYENLSSKSEIGGLN